MGMVILGMNGFETTQKDELLGKINTLLDS